MRSVFVIFVTLASLIVVAAHGGLYLTLVKLLHIEPGALRRALFWVLLVLSVSFIGSLLLIHWRENLATRIPYLLSSVWTGAFVYLLIACVAAWILVLLLRVSGINGVATERAVASVVFLAAIGFSIYGLWNAANPVVRSLMVTIRDLPEAWRGRKIAQISDVHIGAILREGFLSRVVELTNAQKPDMVVITGDLFDGSGPELGRLAQPLDGLQAPLGTYFITGNHETYVGLDKSLEALSGLKLRILRDEVVEIDGVQLVGIDYPLMGQRKNLDSVMARVDRGKPIIVLYHEPAFSDTMKPLGVDLQLAGHTHRGQMWPFNYITRRVYRGLDHGLYQDGDYSLYTSCGTGTWGPPLRSGNRPEVVVFTLVGKSGN